MELPMLDYLQWGNEYTGSDGERDEFRYRFKPEKETVRVWAYRDWCFAYCQEHGLVLGEAEFPLDEKGLEQAREWLLERRRML